MFPTGPKKFICRKCSHSFILPEAGSLRIPCPACGSKDLEMKSLSPLDRIFTLNGKLSSGLKEKSLPPEK